MAHIAGALACSAVSVFRPLGLLVEANLALRVRDDLYVRRGPAVPVRWDDSAGVVIEQQVLDCLTS